MVLLIPTFLLSQTVTNLNDPKNFFRTGITFGLGLGTENIDLIEYEAYDEDNSRVSSGNSSISGGGGWSINLLGEYIFDYNISLGINLGYQSSFLRPNLDNATVRFNRFTIQPTLKYIIPLNSWKDQSINLGAGYGFYLSGKMKFDARDVDLIGTIEYKNASGMHFITEYESRRDSKVGYNLGIKYYLVSYDSTKPIDDNDFDPITGNGIDFYFGLLFRI